MAYITLNKNNFFYNLDIIAQQTKSKEKIALVLKDNAYGHGLLEIATLAKEYGIKRAVVQTHSEAEKITSFFEYVLVLAEIPKRASKSVRYTINDLRDIEKFPQGTLVELKVNTGMNRNGIEPEQLQEALERIALRKLRLEAIFTHHACADEMDGIYEMQKERFAKVKAVAPEGVRFHSCNSAALFREDNFCEDMARVGIAAYGCLEMPEVLKIPQFKPVLSLYAQQISQRLVKVGEKVGYGASYTANKDEIVSNYNFGYGDGFLRSCSGEFVTHEGVRIAGRISMDNSSFISEAQTLCIFENACDVAKYAKTISYEVLTSLKPELQRSVV